MAFSLLVERTVDRMVNYEGPLKVGKSVAWTAADWDSDGVAESVDWMGL
jgi:hypothetical protein